MKATLHNGSFKENLLDLYEENRELISRNDTSYASAIRSKGFGSFKNLALPDRKNELWKNTDLSDALKRDYVKYFDKTETGPEIDFMFTCDVHNFETDQVSFLNGWHVRTAKEIQRLPEGVIIGSLSDAFRLYPDLIERHYGRYADSGKDLFLAMNTAFARDGLFIFIPDNVVLEKPLQMISIINHNDNLLLQNRNLVILGKNSHMTLVMCDDSTNHQASFNNSVTEIFLDENASLEHYKLQNLNNSSTLLNSTYFHQEAGSILNTYAITLNGGLIRNYSQVKLNGQGADARINGLYLVDKKQHVDNRVFVEHAVPDCSSNELFKGILDDEATAVFNGHVLVQRDAQRTNAYQQNRNILLTDKATVNTRPFLEIYADDVKCSHGATVGQLDNEALFYLRSRGICLASARLLLMYAFAAEVINKMSLDPLKNRVDEMVKQRLRGELHICETCVLHCAHQEKEIHFDIDLSKI
ncbi:MAG: Fe-S cluster assembly protein SufD [Bacteroidales bacterium]|jgi:Fe-S cluster assembly protein SufD|nr:Fe-S cluster assembly protein SufD [Bacteroidales bacterium]